MHMLAPSCVQFDGSDLQHLVTLTARSSRPSQGEGEIYPELASKLASKACIRNPGPKNFILPLRLARRIRLSVHAGLAMTFHGRLQAEAGR
jgi:hypothetical protein